MSHMEIFSEMQQDPSSKYVVMIHQLCNMFFVGFPRKFIDLLQLWVEPIITKPQLNIKIIDRTYTTLMD